MKILIFAPEPLVNDWTLPKIFCGTALFIGPNLPNVYSFFFYMKYLSY